MDFSLSTIWIRNDLSIALSGFVNATIPIDEWPYYPDGSRYEIEIYYPTNPNGFPELSPKIDLSDWATFIWQLMRKDASSYGAKRWAMPTDDPMEMPGEGDTWEYHKQRLEEGKLQLLEEERLGPMLVKAWKGEYENAQEILQEVRSYLQQIGVRMDGEQEDEVLLDDGRKWEDVFTVVQTDGVRWGREIRYK